MLKGKKMNTEACKIFNLFLFTNLTHLLTVSSAIYRSILALPEAVKVLFVTSQYWFLVRFSKLLMESRKKVEKQHCPIEECALGGKKIQYFIKTLNPNEQRKIFLSAVELKYLCH